MTNSYLWLITCLLAEVDRQRASIKCLVDNHARQIEKTEEKKRNHVRMLDDRYKQVAIAEKQVRDMAIENERLRRENARLRSLMG